MMQNYEKFQNSAKETTSFSNSEFSNHYQELLSQVDGVALLDEEAPVEGVADEEYG